MQRKRSALDGIEVVHQRHCRHRTGRCTCSPSYRVQVWDARARKLQRKTFRVKAEAITWRDDVRVAVRTGTIRPQARTTVAEAAQALIAGIGDGTVLDRTGKPYKPSTRRSYAQAINAYLEPDLLASVALSDVRRRDVQDYADRLRNMGLSPSTIANKLDPIRVIFRRALRRDEIAVDPTVELELPAVRGRRERIAGRAEAAALIDALPEAERALWATALYAGLRRGELRGLRWSDVDLASEPAVVHVRRTWDDAEGEVDVKTEAGFRTVPLTGRLRALVVEHGLTTRRGGDDLVFGRTASDPFTPTTVRTRALTAWGWKRIPNPEPEGSRMVWVKARGDALDPLTPHEARHCAASYLIEAGLNDLELTATIGHSDSRTTKRIYGHLFPDSGATIAAKLDAYLEGDPAAP
jgi:integrase